MMLLDEKNELGCRQLIVRIEKNGDLIFDGWDLNKSPVLGIKEYEWTWTVVAEGLARLSAALATKELLLSAIEERFVGGDSLEIKAFLDRHKIAYKMWSWRS